MKETFQFIGQISIRATLGTGETVAYHPGETYSDIDQSNDFVKSLVAQGYFGPAPDGVKPILSVEQPATDPTNPIEVYKKSQKGKPLPTEVNSAPLDSPKN